MSAGIREILTAYFDCMHYLRQCKTTKKFDDFEKNMHKEMSILEQEEKLAYDWVLKARDHYRGINNR